MRALLMVPALLVLAAGCGRRAGDAGDTSGRVDSVPRSMDSSRATTVADTLPPAAPAESAQALAPAAAAAPKSPTKPAPKSTARTPASPPAQGSDTVRGKAAVVGSSPFTNVVVRSGSGSTRISGPLAPEIGRASGAEVWVKGRRTDRGIEAAEYHVRSVDGVSAIDGVLVSEGERLYLRLADGSRRAIVSPSAALRAEAGARVWITGGIDGPVAAYGVLRPRS